MSNIKIRLVYVESVRRFYLFFYISAETPCTLQRSAPCTLHRVNEESTLTDDAKKEEQMKTHREFRREMNGERNTKSNSRNGTLNMRNEMYTL